MATDVPPDQVPVAQATSFSGVLVFLLNDVEGSTYRWEQFPAAMRDALERHDRLVNESVVTHHGQVFRTVGDSFHAVHGPFRRRVRRDPGPESLDCGGLQRD